MSTVAERLRQLRRDAGLDVVSNAPGTHGPAAKAPPSSPVGDFSRQREKEGGTRKVGKFPGQREKEIPDELPSFKQVQDGTLPLSVIPAQAGLRRLDAGANFRIANGPKGKPLERRVIHLDFEQKELDPGLRRDDENEVLRDDANEVLRDDANEVLRDDANEMRRDDANEMRRDDENEVLRDDANEMRRDDGNEVCRDDEIEERRVGKLDALRRLIRARERPLRTLQPRRALAPPAGEEIAPGLRCVETRLAYPADATLEVPAIDEAPIDRRRLLCFDTETTGLAGGVGTRAFMIGVAAWNDNVLTVRQLYLTAIAGECAMLQLFADWLREDTILVSYNGKSYDAPLLKGRFRLNRVAHRLAELPHIDWLHPTRRIYKGHLPNCRLATIEREVLRIVREDDLPGSEAPAAWLAFLRGQSSTNLARVIEHNRQDVITLMRLGDHITSLRLGA